MKKLVNIKGHVRHKQGHVETVRSHSRKMDVKEQTLDEFQKRIKKLQSKGKDYPLQYNDWMDTLEAYSGGFHTFHEFDLMGENDSVSHEIYKNMMELIPKKLNGKSALHSLVDGEGRKKRLDKVEQLFQTEEFKKMYKVKNTERLSPFVLRLEHEFPDEMISSLSSEMGWEFLGATAGQQTNNPNLLRNLVTGAIKEIMKTGGIQKGTILYDIVPKLAVEHVLTTRSEGIKPLVDLNNPKAMERFQVKPGSDPEKYRKDFIRFLGEKGLLTDDLRKNIKEMKINRFIPWRDAFLATGHDVSEFRNTDMIDKLQKNLLSIFQSTIGQKISSLRYSYISNNPLDFLSMSPKGRFESCQSISDTVNTNNSNILSHIWANSYDDFVWYTAEKTKNGYEKTSRKSVTLLENEFVNWEYGEWYGMNDLDIYKTFWKNMPIANKDRPIKEYDIQDGVYDHLLKREKQFEELDGEHLAIVQNYDVEKSIQFTKKLEKVIEDILPETESYDNILKRLGVFEKIQSLHYGATSIDMFKENYLIAKRFKDVYNETKNILEWHNYRLQKS